MKKRLIPLFLLCSLCLLPPGCGKAVPEGTPGDGPLPVLFRQSAPATKASADAIHSTGTAYIPSGTDFGLFGWTGGTVTGAPDYMYNQPVHNNGGSVEGEFTYEPQKYWPNDDTPLSFVAYYPYGCTGLTLSGPGEPLSLTYSSAYSPSMQKDLLVARSLDNRKSDGKVNLAFTHALAKVILTAEPEPSFATNSSAVVVHSVTLYGVRDHGTWTPDGGWQVTGSALSYTCAPTGADSEALLLVPQPTAGMTVEADFTVHILDEHGASLSQTRQTLTAPLPTATVTQWEEGKSYPYRIVIRETHLEVTATVEPWVTDEHNYDYSTEVSVADGGTLAWTPGTYASQDYSSYRIVTRFDTDLEASFRISTPEGAVWYAVLETLSGDSDAFAFVGEDGALSSSAHGLVGETASLTIRQRERYPAETNMARLTFVVRTAGRNIPVTSLVDNQNHNWTIVQNANH